EADYPLTVLDIDRRKMAQVIAAGAQAAATPAEVAEACDVIILCLPGSHAVEEVMEGPDGALTRLEGGRLVIDTGTSRPATAVRYEKLCAEKRAGFIDAPITWRSEGLIIMVGGTTENFERGREVLERLSFKLRHVGPIGSGQMLKLANQMILAGQLAVHAEAVTFAEKCGLDPRLLRDYLDFPISEALYGDDFTGGGQLALHYKDLGYTLELAHDNGANIPVTGVAHEAFKFAHVSGEPDWTQPGIVTYWRRLAGAEEPAASS
ncbi:MAG: NAD(P)-dependent oxidoreductase, partial [Armatimonadota bacterium]